MGKRPSVTNTPIVARVNNLRMKAADRFNTLPENCHIGHIVLEGLLEMPSNVHQIDGATGAQETNSSIASRTMRLASAMHKFGLSTGDPVIIMGNNHLDLAVPYYACHYNGYSMCSISPSAQPEDLPRLYQDIKPKIVFCQKENVEPNEKALKANDLKAPIVTFDDTTNDLESFIKKYSGTDVDFRPAEFDTTKIAAWLMLTSGTTGVPKVAIIPFDTLLTGVVQWWKQVENDLETALVMMSTQWLSALMFYITTPIKGYVRLQSSQMITPHLLVYMINKYKPDATAWTPFLLARFVQATQKVCDLSCFKHIVVGGSTVEKHVLDAFKKICNARLYLFYGMTELLSSIFIYNQDDTPWGSSGKAIEAYQYRLIDNESGQIVKESNKSGELWVKGGAFFKGYLNNEEETKEILTEDGWLKTGDIFYRDDNDYYYFVERKRLLFKYQGNFVSPLQIEKVIKQHPNVSEACVVAVKNATDLKTASSPGIDHNNEMAIAVVMTKNGAVVDPQEIFDLVIKTLPVHKHLHGGLFFIESFPTTPSGKINRSQLVEIAKNTEKIMPKSVEV